MNLINTPTIVSAAEASVIGMQQDAQSGLDSLKAAAISSFRRLWDDFELRADKLAVMGTNAVTGFEQHHDTVTFLLRSFARGFRNEVEISTEDFAALLTDAPTWIMTHQEHPMTVKVFSIMPPDTFIPPAAYTPHIDGTITLDA